ncbi:hypothetical protein HS7_01530 [Sulfolobales archaeon HS-7]|nr:hypothetical protein HS7_01530 [Sulfolobales archaeon HS-7]
MDQIDREILVDLLRNGRRKTTSLASLLRLLPQVIGYRIDKMEKEGIIKGYSCYVDPNALGLYHGILIFRNRKNYNGELVSRFECMEEFNVYQIAAKSQNELEEKSQIISEELGEPILKYIPERKILEIDKTDYEIISFLRKEPTIPVYKIAEKIGVNPSIVKKRIEFMIKEAMVRIYPIIDLERADIAVFSLFSRKIGDIYKLLNNFEVFHVESGDGGFLVGSATSIKKAKNLLDACGFIDKNLWSMLVVSYSFY